MVTVGSTNWIIRAVNSHEQNVMSVNQIKAKLSILFHSSFICQHIIFVINQFEFKCFYRAKRIHKSRGNCTNSSTTMYAHWRQCRYRIQLKWFCVVLMIVWISSMESFDVHWPTRYDYTIADFKICEKGKFFHLR